MALKDLILNVYANSVACVSIYVLSGNNQDFTIYKKWKGDLDNDVTNERHQRVYPVSSTVHMTGRRVQV